MVEVACPSHTLSVLYTGGGYVNEKLKLCEHRAHTRAAVAARPRIEQNKEQQPYTELEQAAWQGRPAITLSKRKTEQSYTELEQATWQRWPALTLSPCRNRRKLVLICGRALCESKAKSPYIE